jgi:hypothetical protein
MHGEQRYSSTHSKPWHYMEVSGQLLAPATLPSAEKLVPIEWKAGWDPESVLTFLRREKSLVPTKNLTLDHPAHCIVTILTMLSCLHYSSVFVFGISLLWQWSDFCYNISLCHVSNSSILQSYSWTGRRMSRLVISRATLPFIMLANVNMINQPSSCLREQMM